MFMLLRCHGLWAVGLLLAKPLKVYKWKHTCEGDLYFAYLQIWFDFYYPLCLTLSHTLKHKAKRNYLFIYLCKMFSSSILILQRVNEFEELSTGSQGPKIKLKPKLKLNHNSCTWRFDHILYLISLPFRWREHFSSTAPHSQHTRTQCCQRLYKRTLLQPWWTNHMLTIW